jgi:hypothetical protein
MLSVTMLSVVMPVITHILQNSKKKIGKGFADKKLKNCLPQTFLTE